MQHRDRVPPNYEDARFVVRFKRQYTCRREYDEEHKRAVRDSKLPKRIDHEKVLQEKLAAKEQEEARNEAESARCSGKPVCFGSVIQLQHVMSGKFVAINKKLHAKVGLI